MTPQTTLNRANYEDYLVRLYFGSDKEMLNACIKRAYLDFNRTMTGFGKFKNAGQLYKKAVTVLKESFKILKSLSSSDSMTQEVFDNWHKTTCEKLTSLFEQQGFHLYIGQAQKWVNMTLKYIFTVGEQRIPSFSPAYPFCHVPLDNIMLEQLKKYGFPALNCAWSRLDNYDEYLQKQNWIRQKFPQVPMDVEFSLWLEKEKEGFSKTRTVSNKRI